jgi:hypothetical protein
MYHKRYNLNELIKTIEGFKKEGRKFVDLEKLLMDIGCDPLDFNEFYITNIRHRVRYNRDDYRDR